MLFTPREKNSKDPDGELFYSLETLIQGMNMALVELNVFRMKARGGRASGVQVKVTIFKEGVIGLDDCTKVHRSILPRLELAFPGQDIFLEVSSPGINRIIKDGSEFIYYIGQTVNCYRTDISDWTSGTLLSADDEKIKLLSGDKEITLPYETIAKAKLDSSSFSLPAKIGG